MKNLISLHEFSHPSDKAPKCVTIITNYPAYITNIEKKLETATSNCLEMDLTI